MNITNNFKRNHFRLRQCRKSLKTQPCSNQNQVQQSLQPQSNAKQQLLQIGFSQDIQECYQRHNKYSLKLDMSLSEWKDNDNQQLQIKKMPVKRFIKENKIFKLERQFTKFQQRRQKVKSYDKRTQQNVSASMSTCKTFYKLQDRQNEQQNLSESFIKIKQICFNFKKAQKQFSQPVHQLSSTQTQDKSKQDQFIAKFKNTSVKRFPYFPRKKQALNSTSYRNKFNFTCKQYGNSDKFTISSLSKISKAIIQINNLITLQNIVIRAPNIGK